MVEFMTMLEETYQLQPLNTFKVKALARYFSTIESIDHAQSTLRNVRFGALPLFILGGGSNVLLTQDYPGLVIKNNIKGIEHVDNNSGHVLLKIGAGESWHDIVLYCLEHSYAGIENLSLIPGTVGAAPIQNIGAYGVELESVFHSLDAIELASGKIKHFTHADCTFGYRSSIFKTTLKNQYLITHVTLKLNHTANLQTEYGAIQTTLQQMDISNPSIKDVSNAVIKIRQQKLPDPKQLPNAGSFFKNPVITQPTFDALLKKFPSVPHFPQPRQHVKVPAAWLIEQCQLKGYRQNGVGISPDHALVLINYASEHGNELLKLSELVRNKVQEKFGLTLENEINIIT